MKTHILKSGVLNKDVHYTYDPLCGTNRGAKVALAEVVEEATCGRCKMLSERVEYKHADIPVKGFESEFERDSVVHFGKKTDMLGPDERAWCHMRIVHSQHAYVTHREEKVTCKKCLRKMKRNPR